MSTIDKSLDECLGKLKVVSEVLSGYSEYDGWGFHLKELKGLWNAVQDYLPCKVGDDVILLKTPDCDNGWSGSKHFLKKCAIAVVKDITIYNGQFIVYLEFYNETWIDTKGEEHKPSRKHTFMFSMKDVKKIE